MGGRKTQSFFAEIVNFATDNHFHTFALDEILATHFKLLDNNGAYDAIQWPSQIILSCSLIITYDVFITGNSYIILVMKHRLAPSRPGLVLQQLSTRIYERCMIPPLSIPNIL